MLETDDLILAAAAALGRVEPSPTNVRLASPCRVNHADIARSGVEEGLKLALRALRDRSGSLSRVPTDHPTDGHASEASAPATAVSPQDPWR